MGKLIATVGSMGCGKTENLINLHDEFLCFGEKVQVYKSKLDTREDGEFIRSRNGQSIPAKIISNLEEIKAEKDTYIFIDEIQFFTQSNIIEVLNNLCLQGCDVLVFGLDLTSDGKTFGRIGDILANADEVYKLYSLCTECGIDRSRFSYHKGTKEAEIKIGDLDEYTPVCRECYAKLMREKECS